jgi:hypothetical protein
MKMDDFKIEYLADRSDCLQACAAWAYGRWGVQKKDGSLERAISIFKVGTPLYIVLVNKIIQDLTSNWQLRDQASQYV